MKVTAGLLMYRKVNNNLEVFLVHFGGPFWAKKDNGAWHIPKGLVDPSAREDLITCATREFQEETGAVIASEAKQSFVDLGYVEYNSKRVYCWAFEGDLPKDSPRFAGEAGFVFKSNKTPNGWDENDRGQFFPIDEATTKILPAQKVFLERLTNLI